MRLTSSEIIAIKAAVAQVAGTTATVRLFGSRMDDDKQGGDIDLLVESPLPVENSSLTAARIEAQIIMALGDQKIDVLLKAPNLMHLPIHEVAEKGILL
ncbi:MAG TPA: nucleotidyltransferase domain-containing protein [Rheinheimera sp.]|uniref:nucleotidyltransferase domain-containing protein n=1 Tax=Rheinheimera sp. TaxID=1869214 RepID=UPI002B487F01|nr:nucleotidyltransferase domain-containing protein [Rheinheimera sp.]HJS14851.1 nucleotidyltransferase domain-containing protein [Rheinheimera sp.]